MAAAAGGLSFSSYYSVAVAAAGESLVVDATTTVVIPAVDAKMNLKNPLTKVRGFSLCFIQNEAHLPVLAQLPEKLDIHRILNRSA